MRRALGACGLVLVAGALGCGGSGRAPAPERAETRAVAEVVARVGGRPIGASEVAARMSSDGVDADTAIARLVDEELLVREAESRGVVLDGESERHIERSMVRAMLHDFERESAPEAISAAEVRADFEKHQDKYQVPERRRSWHILVKDSSQAGRQVARAILAEVRAAEVPRRVFERYQAGEGEPEVEILAEELPPISQKAGMEKPYKDALFEAESEGVLKSLVETSYGFHVVVLTEIVPGEKRAVQDVEGDIRSRLSQQKRLDRVVSTVRALEAEGLVEYDDEGVEKLLAASKLPERSEALSQ